MAFLLEPRNRIVIPRWRSFDRGFGNEEIIILKQNKIVPVVDQSVLQDKIDDWKRSGNISNALELVNASYSLGFKEDEFIEEEKELSHISNKTRMHRLLSDADTEILLNKCKSRG